jgi:septum site-determining protein MinD
VGKVYAISSGKGGVGKTTITMNLGAGLALAGRETLLVDADLGMGDLGIYLGLEDVPVTLSSVLSKSHEPAEAIQNFSEKMDVIPTSHSVEDFLRADLRELSGVVDALKEDYSFVLIDTPPGLDKDSLLPLDAADEVLLVVNPEIPSIVGALKFASVAETLGHKVAGVILNKYRTRRRKLVKKIPVIDAAQVKSMLGFEVLGVIPEDKNFIKDAELKKPLVLRKPKVAGSKAIMELSSKLQQLAPRRKT